MLDDRNHFNDLLKFWEHKQENKNKKIPTFQSEQICIPNTKAPKMHDNIKLCNKKSETLIKIPKLPKIPNLDVFKDKKTKYDVANNNSLAAPKRKIKGCLSFVYADDFEYLVQYSYIDKEVSKCTSICVRKPKKAQYYDCLKSLFPFFK
ncbi:hypothetical protein EDEG_03714 [Edhazardia aedis USNM 41457]|uniref:Uncharacterized protein n=1 Tax=Edhazardia aedis (strain USNM 41457) TaxID=1003232 RepID=J9DK98_EDHAE|nr:hypothetical protein EDEG_03714 [Edhazardia aedis USNM 41457]|eukprot:EJW01797.1 hypothetical protein EDEG_03714 [Edhazardia aedis USNM 41457]